MPWVTGDTQASGLKGRQIPAQGRGRRPMPWVTGDTQARGLKGRQIPAQG